MPKPPTKIDTTPTIINETPPQQMPKSPTKIVSEMPQTNDQNDIITEPTQDIPHPTMELTTDEFPTLPSKNQTPKLTPKPHWTSEISLTTLWISHQL